MIAARAMHFYCVIIGVNTWFHCNFIDFWTDFAVRVILEPVKQWANTHRSIDKYGRWDIAKYGAAVRSVLSFMSWYDSRRCNRFMNLRK